MMHTNRVSLVGLGLSLVGCALSEVDDLTTDQTAQADTAAETYTFSGRQSDLPTNVYWKVSSVDNATGKERVSTWVYAN